MDPKAFDTRFVEEVQHSPGLMARLLHKAKPGVSYRIKNAPEFANLVQGYVDYHAPSQKNFPSVSHEVVEAPMNTEQMGYYNYLLGKAGPALAWKIKHGMPPGRQDAKALNTFLTGTRQVSNTTATYGGAKLSPKIQTAVSRLKTRASTDKNFKGLVYSNFLDSGVKAYARRLDEEGISHAIFSGELSDRERKKVVRDYNQGKTKVLLISGAGAQGLDLKGTKLCQILEPHFNSARLEQAVGRAIRYKSHEHLPEDQRHVHIETYHATVPQTAFQRLIHTKPEMSVDQYLSQMATDKDKLNSQFTDILKRVGSRE
jgi:hypothetical protein